MRLPTLLESWEAIHEAGPSAAGGKAWQLSRLDRYGLPVPDSLVIPAEAERIWLAGCETISCFDDQTPDSAEIGSGEIHRRLLAHPPPAFLGQALSLALSAKGWLELPLAVRSSATAEDSQTASFAGIHQTRLNLIGLQAVLEGVREVWASRWLPQAFAYRQRFGIDPATDAMAVLIMPLLHAEASGIAFTCDPRSGRDDRLILHAHWGLGESLVGGEAVGDEILLEEDPLDDSLRLSSYGVGGKAVMRLPVSGGTQAVATPAERADARVFDDRKALKLGELVRNAAIALDFSRPFFDLEWLWDGDRFWLVQARPVTTRAHNTYPALQAQAEIWSRGNTRDVTPHPLSVYDWFAISRMTNMILVRPQAAARYPLRPGAQRAGLFAGRLFLNLSLMQWELYDAFGFPPKVINALVGGHQPEIALPDPSLGQRVARLYRFVRVMLRSKLVLHGGQKIVKSAHALARQWREEPLPEGEKALVARLRKHVRVLRDQKSLFFLQAASGGTLPVLVNLLEARLPGEGHALAAALMAGGEPSVTAKQAYELAELANIARNDAVADAWLADPGRSNDWQAALPEGNPFRIAFADFIERYGHRAIYETYIRHPRWREDAAYLLDTLHGLRELNLEALRAQQRHAAREAEVRARRHLPFWLRPLLKSLIKASSRETRHREAARSALISLVEPQRRILLRLAQRWQARGIIEDPNAVFELSLPELQAHADGELTDEGLAFRLGDRQRALAELWNRSVPEVLLDHGDERNLIPEEIDAPMGDSDAFQGMAVGTGRASGAVRILRSPDEGVRLAPGEVLVAPSTDPSWTPLFLKAGALIMETGGYLSHGAIVAREFGIPAVVNLPGILERLSEGERVEVDGCRGRIRRLPETH